MLVHDERLRHRRAQRIDREVDIGGARFAAFAERAGDGFVEFGGHARRIAHGAGVTGDRAHDLRGVHVLQPAAILLRLRIAARQNEDRRARHMGVGDAGHGVGESGPGRDERHAEFACQFRMGLRHMDRRALVTHVDDADPLGVDAHPHRHDVAAAQSEDAFHAARFQHARDDRGGAVVRDFHGTAPVGAMRGRRDMA